MEWNSKSSLFWDWDLYELEAKAHENTKKLQQRTDCSVELDRGISSGSLHSPGDDGSGSDFGHASSKSSVSASINSSSFGESKASNKFTLDGFEPSRGLAKVPTSEISAGSGEPFLSLKLGKRMYFKDICADSKGNGKTSPPPTAAASMSSVTTSTKRSKSTSLRTLAPRCQVEGCNLDLSSAKDYHRKHRICENHSKSPRVIVGGVERRFCQQCSRFHGLSEFDEKKRSCRRRLSDHNARRRKPQPEAVRLNPARYSSIFDETEKMSLVFDQGPRLYSRTGANITWENTTENLKLGHTREYLSRPGKTNVPSGQLLLPNNNEMPGSVTMLYPHDSARLTSNKSTLPEYLHSGLEEPVVSTELNTTQDLHRALSLLSTSSWGSREGKPASIGTTTSSLNNINHSSSNMVQQAMNTHPIAQGLPLASSEYWQTEQPAIHTEPIITAPRSNGGSLFQDLHLFKAPNESGFYSYQFN